ncbi:MAG: translesion DNA synthesis-associated protein ImuA [Gammaproteobacteria bacterium]|nr:translesion DNA synthesis-associated protein ImuA [Gammaproteobacteria bacterium]
MNAQLKSLLDTRNDLWCAKRNTAIQSIATVSTNHQSLNQALLNGGWPLSVSTEILCNQVGIGEVSILLPTLANLSQQEKWIALIAPPHTPYSPALEQAGIDTSKILMIHPRNEKELLWATEQALKTGTCSAVISWFGNREIKHKDLLRLQHAAKNSDCLHIQFRATEFSEQPSPAQLRVTLSSSDNDLMVNVVKQRGFNNGQAVAVPRSTLLLTQQPKVIELRTPKQKSKRGSMPSQQSADINQHLTWQ